MERASLITGRSAWTSRDLLEDPGTWMIELTGAEAAEVEALVAGLTAQGKTLDAVRREDFSRPVCDRIAARISGHLGGAGFALLRGVPVQRLGPRGSAMLFWGLGSMLGKPLPQNEQGDRLYEVADQHTEGVPVLSSKTNAALPWHTDSGSGAFAGAVPDLLGLLAVRTAASGGTSHLMSAHTAHNVLLDRYPDHLARLFEPYYFDRTLQMQPGETPYVSTPVFDREGGVVGIRYNRQRIVRGHQMAGVPLGEWDSEALDALDEVLDEPELALRFDMEPGDALFSHNRTTLHNRTAFVDGEALEKTRLLYRLWIKMAQ